MAPGKVPVIVSFDFVLKSFDFVSSRLIEIKVKTINDEIKLQSETSSTMTIQSYIQMSWFDERLIWNEDDFKKVPFAHASTDELWLPDITVYNS